MKHILNWPASGQFLAMLTRTVVVGMLISALVSGAHAQDSIDGILPQGISYASGILVVTGPSQGTAMACGVLGEMYNVMLIKPKEPPTMTKLVVPLGTDISVGLQLNVKNGTNCSATHVLLGMRPAENSA